MRRTLRILDLHISTWLVIVVVSAVGIVAPNLSICQTRDQSAAEIIDFLTSPVKPPNYLNTQLMRREDPDRAAANELVALGEAAVDDLEAAMDRMEQETDAKHLV